METRNNMNIMKLDMLTTTENPLRAPVAKADMPPNGGVNAEINNAIPIETAAMGNITLNMLYIIPYFLAVSNIIPISSKVNVIHR